MEVHYVLPTNFLQKEPALFCQILPIPGSGHEELTMLQACFELVWSILGEEFAVSHGYKTEWQQEYL